LGSWYNKIIELDVVESTMDEARKLGFVDEGTVLVARSQTGGRGRQGRKWYSPDGGLWFTIILYPNNKANKSVLLTPTAALAVCRGLSITTGLSPTIKLLNDVYLRGKKVAGILIEMDVQGDTVNRAFVGVGVNANFNLDELPADLKDKATTLLHELGAEVNLKQLLTNILKEFEELYDYFKKGQYAEILRQVKNSIYISKDLVKVHLINGTCLVGMLEDLDESGRLFLNIDKNRVILSLYNVERITKNP
jgi:BirA family biotin operon repressor/biotin-[acetyl-CoA-carboxylase] ligase